MTAQTSRRMVNIRVTLQLFGSDQRSHRGSGERAKLIGHCRILLLRFWDVKQPNDCPTKPGKVSHFLAFVQFSKHYSPRFPQMCCILCDYLGGWDIVELDDVQSD